MNARKTNEKDDRYYFAFLLQQEPEGYSDKHTPQHITLVPPLYASEKLLFKTGEVVSLKFQPFLIKLGRIAMFGPKKDIPVIKVETNETLTELHLALLDELKREGIYLDSDFIGNEYRPHVAIKKFHPEIEPGQQFLFDHIALIHKYKNIKNVLSKDKFNG